MSSVSNNYSNSYNNYQPATDTDKPDTQTPVANQRKSGDSKNRSNKNQRQNQASNGKNAKSGSSKGANESNKQTGNQKKAGGQQKDVDKYAGHDNVDSTAGDSQDSHQVPASKLDGGFVDAGTDKINFKVDHPQKGSMMVGITNQKLSVYIPKERAEGELPTISAIADGETIELDFTDAENWTDTQLELLESISGAFADFDPSDRQTPGAGLAQTVKARLEALQDPSFWTQVGEAQATKEEKVETLANGREVIVKNEFDLKPVGRDSSGVIYDVFNPGDGKTTHGVRVTEDGFKATTGSKKGDTSPIRVAEDGSLKVVMSMEKYSETESKQETLDTIMHSYVTAAPIRALPVAMQGGNTIVNQISEGGNGKLSFQFNREQGAIERVEVGTNAVTFTTLVPEGVLTGVDIEPDENGLIKFERKISFADIAELSSTDKASFNALKEALAGVDIDQSLPSEETTLNKINARIEALENPLFWGTVNGEVQSRINNVMNGEPVEIKEEFKLIERTPVGQDGSTKVEFYVDRGDGKGKEKLELLDDNKVKVGKETFDVRQDEESGDWFMVTEFSSLDKLNRQVISSNMKLATAKAEPSDRIPLINIIDNSARNAELLDGNPQVLADDPQATN